MKQLTQQEINQFHKLRKEYGSVITADKIFKASGQKMQISTMFNIGNRRHLPRMVFAVRQFLEQESQSELINNANLHAMLRDTVLKLGGVVRISKDVLGEDSVLSFKTVGNEIEVRV